MAIYVYSAVPPGSQETIKEYGLLSGVNIAKNKKLLSIARPTKKSREDFVKKVEDTVNSDRPYAVLGPSVLFTLPDESKITDKHFIKEWGLIPIRINLSRLVKDYPKTVIWGAELLPIKDKWKKLSDEAFDRKIEKEYGLTWEEFLEARSHELTLADVRKYSKMQPKDLWSNYEHQHVGKYYAANVPHAFIITPMGYIPYAYVEFMNPRQNPTKEWFLEPQFLKNDQEGFLVNPDTNDIYWYHGMVGKPGVDYIRDPKESGTLYLSSSLKTAKDFAQVNNAQFGLLKAGLHPQVYEVFTEIPASKVFDIRKAVYDESYRNMAIQMLSKNPFAYFSLHHFKSVYSAMELLQFEMYDHNFNVNERSKSLLKEYGFVGWLETESDVRDIPPTKIEPLSLALLQEETEDLIFIKLEED